MKIAKKQMWAFLEFFPTTVQSLKAGVLRLADEGTRDATTSEIHVANVFILLYCYIV